MRIQSDTKPTSAWPTHSERVSWNAPRIARGVVKPGRPKATTMTIPVRSTSGGCADPVIARHTPAFDGLERSPCKSVNGSSGWRASSDVVTQLLYNQRVIKTLGVRGFLHGGYAQRKEPVLVMRHAQPLGIWIPIVDGVPVRGTVPATELEYLVSDREGAPPWGREPSAAGEDR